MKGLKTGEKSEAEAASSRYDDAKEGAEQKTVEKEADAEDPANKAGEYVQIKAKENVLSCFLQLKQFILLIATNEINLYLLLLVKQEDQYELEFKQTNSLEQRNVSQHDGCSIC